MRYSVTGDLHGRTGNINRQVVPASNFPTADGREITLHAGTDSLFRRLCTLMGDPALQTDARYADHASRVANQDDLYATIGAWTARHTADALMALLVGADVPSSTVMTMQDIATDPHYRDRGTITAIEDAEFGPMLMAASMPRMTATPGSVRSLGPTLGAHNDEIFAELLGLSSAEMGRLRDAGTI